MNSVSKLLQHITRVVRDNSDNNDDDDEHVHSALSHRPPIGTKHTFVMTKDVFCSDKLVCHDKSKLVATKVLSPQKYVCYDKCFVASSIPLLRGNTKRADDNEIVINLFFF